MKNIFNFDKLCCGYETRRDALKGNLLFPVLLAVVTIFCFSFGLMRTQNMSIFSYYATSTLLIVVPALLVSIYFAQWYNGKDRLIKKHIKNLNLNKVMSIYLSRNELSDNEDLTMSIVFGYQLLSFLLLSANMLYKIDDNLIMISFIPLGLMAVILVMFRVLDYFTEVYPIKDMKEYSKRQAESGNISNAEIYDFITTYEARVEKRNIENNFLKKQFSSGKKSQRV